METLYLAHNFGTRKKIRKWELKMEGRYNINLDNPFYDNPERKTEMKILDAMKEGSKEMIAYLCSRDDFDIVENDLKKIRKSDGIVALAINSKKFATMIGTPMEIFFAARILRIPVYIITKRFAFHPWIKKHATMTFSSTLEFEKFLEKNWGRKK